MKKHILSGIVTLLISTLFLFSWSTKKEIQPTHLTGEAQGAYYNIRY
ncbi:MAG: hypothetical protein IEMM0006_1375 [bacterium]|nr:MAG: hypothetical protein IEMM0006_1375 [bacterium]